MTRQKTSFYNRRWRAAALAALGGKCVRCGFDDVRALQIDHVHGDGKGERASQQYAQGAYYRRVAQEAAKGSGKYQLLCSNCNWIKRYENNEHGASRRPNVVT